MESAAWYARRRFLLLRIGTFFNQERLRKTLLIRRATVEVIGEIA